MSEIDPLKKESDKFNSAFAKLNKEDPIKYNLFEQGKDVAFFDAAAANIPKYASYGSEIYGKLGFDPLKLATAPGTGNKKSELDVLYDTSTPWTTDFGRARKGAWDLAGIGFQDTFAQGLFKADDNYLDFESTMNKYSSSRDDVKTLANAQLSSGYTMGIITGIAAEELVIGAVTAATGFTSAPVTGGLAVSTLGRGVNKIIKGLNVLSDIKAARTWLGKGTIALGKKLNPLENTIDLFKNLDNLKDLNNWKQAGLGAAAVVRDARKITMSHGESKLEADLAKKEFKDSQFDFFKKENIKLGLGNLVTDRQLNNIEAESDKVYNNVYQGNFGLIYATNAITFDNMFKSMKSTNFIAKNLYNVVKNKGSNLVAVNVLKDNIFNSVRNYVGKLTFKSVLNFGLSSSMEGVQEVGQDLISNSVQSYRARNVQGKQLRGSFLTYLENDLKNAAVKSYKDGTGFESFLSGALMGVFAGPVGFATGRANSYLFNGGIGKTYQYVANNAQYKADKLSLEKKRNEKAQNLTNFFNSTNTFLQTINKTIYSQQELQEVMIGAANNNDAKTFNTAKNSSFVNGVVNLMESGLDNEFADHLKYMADQFSVDELQEIFARKDINETNASKYREKLSSKANEVKQIREEYDNIKLNYINPYNLKNQASDNPSSFFNTFIKHQAFEDFKKEMLFNKTSIQDRAVRLKAIEKEIRNETLLSATETSAFLTDESLKNQIALLETEYSAAKELKGKDASQIFKKLTAFKNYAEKLDAYKKLQNQSEITISDKEEYNTLFDAYMEVMTAYDIKNNPNSDFYTSRKANLELAFTKIFDYQNLGIESDYLTQYANILNTFDGADSFLKAREDLLIKLDQDKEQYIKDALEEFDKRQLSDEMLTKLKDAGLFFDLNELDELIKNGVMPSVIYNLATDEIVEATTTEYNTAVDIIKSYYKKLTGKKIQGSAKSKFGRKYTKDKRTLSTILRTFSIKMGGQIDFSTKKGAIFLQKLLASDNITSIDKEILQAIKNSNAKIRFVNNNPLPVTVNNGLYELDLRYASSDYVNSTFSFENLIITALVQNEIFENLKNNDDLYHTARRAMEQAKSNFLKLYPGASIENIDAFQKVEVFLSEALNDPSLQRILASITDELQPTKTSLLGTIKDVVNSISSEETKFENLNDTLLNRVINIALKATDKTITSPISEVEEKISETEKANQLLTKEKLDELKKKAEALGKRWGVNVEIVENQRDAQKIISKKKNLFQQRFSEILNNLMYPPVQGIDLRKNVSAEEVRLIELIKDIYNKSESLSELISNLKDLSAYQTNNKLVDMVEFISENSDNITDALGTIKDLFFQASEDQSAGFYDEETNTAYIVADAVRSNTMYHEIFLHPYIINLEKQNPELYRKLVKEARADSEIVDYITKTYGDEETIGSRQFEHELIGRAFDLNVNNQLETPNRLGLVSSIKEFAKNLLNKVLEFLGINTLNRKIFNQSSTTISELAEYVVKGKENYNLGRIIEIDKEINEVIPETEIPDNITLSEAFEDEAEVEIDDAALEQAETETDVAIESVEQVSNFTPEQNISNIQKKINDLENQIALKKKEMESKAGVLNSLKRNKLNLEVINLAQEVNDLYDNIEEIKEQYKLNEASYVELVDDLNISLINHLTPWSQINEQLKEELAKLYGTPLNKLTELDIIKISQNMFNEPNYIALINENYLIQYNRKASIKNKELQQVAIQQEKELNKQNKKTKVVQTNEEIIRGILGKNIAYFTEADINIMAEFLKANENTVDDIRAAALEKAQKKVKADINKQFELEDTIKYNFYLLTSKNLIYNKTKRLRVSNKFIRFVTTYHSKLFSQPEAVFIQNVKMLLINRRGRLRTKTEYDKLLKKLQAATPSEYRAIAQKQLLELEASGYAFPELVKQMNDALYDVKANIKLAHIYRSSKNKTGQASTNYYVQDRNYKPKKPTVKEGIFAKLDSIFSTDDNMVDSTPIGRKAIILNYVINNKVSMSALLSMNKPFEEIDSLQNKGSIKLIIDDDRNKYGQLNKNKKADYLSDLIFSANYESRLEYRDDVEEFFLRYARLDDAINDLYDQINREESESFISNTEESFEEDNIEDDASINKDESNSILAFIEFMNSEEGQKYQEEEINMRALADEELYESYQEESESNTITESEQEKINLLNLLTNIQKISPKDNIKQTKPALTTIKQINTAINLELKKLNAAMQTTFPNAAKLIQFYNDNSIPISKEMITKFLDLSKGHEEVVGVEIDGALMHFEEIDGKLFLYDDTSAPILVSESFNFNKITNVFVEDAVIEVKKNDTTLNKADEKIIIESYADVFNNFASLKTDFNSLTLDQAVEQFKLETSKCK